MSTMNITRTTKTNTKTIKNISAISLQIFFEVIREIYARTQLISTKFCERLLCEEKERSPR